MTHRPSGPLFVIRLRPVAHHPDPIRGLRQLLEIALRCGLRAVSVEQIDEPTKGPDHDDPEAKTDLALQ